jgi:hypothetical protein
MPPLAELVVPVFPAEGFDWSPRPRPLVSRSQLDELLAGQKAEARAALARQAQLARDLGVVCQMPHCRAGVWGGSAHRWQPGWCIVHAPDEVAVERAAAGDHTVVLWPHERVEVVRRLARRGHADT